MTTTLITLNMPIIIQDDYIPKRPRTLTYQRAPFSSRAYTSEVRRPLEDGRFEVICVKRAKTMNVVTETADQRRPDYVAESQVEGTIASVPPQAMPKRNRFSMEDVAEESGAPLKLSDTLNSEQGWELL